MPDLTNICWSYVGAEGPEHWGELHPDWKLCAEGLRQSPIALPEDSTANISAAPQALRFDYARVAARLTEMPYLVRAEVDSGLGIRLGEQDFALRQFHFHTPAEHRWRNSTDADPAEFHLVHRSDSGAIVVLGIPLRYDAEPLLSPALWDDMRTHESGESFTVDLLEMIPATASYFSYSGSLTTPPCTEGVRWLLAGEALGISRESVTWLQRQTGANARPLQPLGDRMVQRVSCCSTHE